MQQSLISSICIHKPFGNVNTVMLPKPSGFTNQQLILRPSSELLYHWHAVDGCRCIHETTSQTQPVVIAAVVGHERLQRGLEPLQLVKSEEVVHCYSCQFRPVPKKFYIPIDSTKHSRVQFHVQSPASVLKKYIYSFIVHWHKCVSTFPAKQLT